MDNLSSPASRSTLQRMQRFQKTITVLVPELAERLARAGGTMHLELTPGTQDVPSAALALAA